MLQGLPTPPRGKVQQSQYKRVRDQLAKLPMFSQAEQDRAFENLMTYPGRYMGLVNGYLPGVRVRIVGQQLLFRPEPADIAKTDYISWQATASAALTYLSMVLKRHAVPPVDFVAGLWDFCRNCKTGAVSVPGNMDLQRITGHLPPPTVPPAGLDDAKLPPTVSWGSRPDCSAIATPMQDWIATTQNFTVGSFWRADTHPRPAWSTRLPKAVWRGAISSWDGSRARALRFGLLYPVMADVKIPANNALGLSPDVQTSCEGYYKSLNASNMYPVSNVDCTGIFGNFMPIEEQMKYKYILDLDGASSTFRMKNLLLSGSVVLKVESPEHPRQFFFQDLQPMVHYIPIRHEFLEGDLLKQMTWLRDNDAMASQIAENARLFAEQHLQWDDALWHTHMSLSVFAEKQAVPPTAELPYTGLPLLPFCCADLPKVAAPGLGATLKPQCVELNQACVNRAPGQPTWLDVASVQQYR